MVTVDKFKEVLAQVDKGIKKLEELDSETYLKDYFIVREEDGNVSWTIELNKGGEVLFTSSSRGGVEDLEKFVEELEELSKQ